MYEQLILSNPFSISFDEPMYNWRKTKHSVYYICVIIMKLDLSDKSQTVVNISNCYDDARMANIVLIVV